MNSKALYAILFIASLCAFCAEVEGKSVIFYNSQGTVGTGFILNGRNMDCPPGQRRDQLKQCRPVRRFRRRHKPHRKPQEA